MNVLSSVIFILFSLCQQTWSYPIITMPDIYENYGLEDLILPGSKKITPEKRGHPPGVDVWQLCPHTMAQADCFYTYLKVYARLRKGAREIDPIHMRNIGKRSFQDDRKNVPEVKNDEILISCPDSTDYLDCLLDVSRFAQRILNVYEGEIS